jgi:preprotein translocase subunit SecY
MLSAFVNSFKIQELRQRILFTLGVIFLCRLISDIPIAGVDFSMINSYIKA